MCEERQSDELRDHSYSVDGEAANPLTEIVAVGAEDEVFIAEEGHGDANGFGGDRGDDDGERQISVGKKMSVKDDKGRVEEVAEDGVRDADQEIAKDLWRRKDATEGNEWAVLRRRRAGRRDW